MTKRKNQKLEGYRNKREKLGRNTRKTESGRIE